MGSLLGDDWAVPLTITDELHPNNSYVASPYCHYVSYPREELHLVSQRRTRTLLAQGLRGLGAVLEHGRLDRVVIVNNWLLSTNLYPTDFARSLPAITRLLVDAFPNHALVFRSLNDVTTPSLLEPLRQLSYCPIVSRRIHLFDARELGLLRRKAYRRDRALVDRHGYQLEHLTRMDDSTAERVTALYRALYLEKYSRHNPAFTPTFVTLAFERQLLDFYVLRRNQRIDGVLGCFDRSGIMTTPFLGYDTTLPQEVGLYRMLTAILSELAADKGLMLHRSSGAANFKRSRGAKSTIEYNWVYTAHLPAIRRAPWTLLRSLANGVGQRMLEKYDR